jgi:sulfur-carrier protein adenylyltransferase/sulfurtransferase
MGGRSRAAAQLLAGKGFDEVYNLKGGIRAWQGHRAAGPEETGMSMLKGDETVEEIIVLACSMEMGLKGFYTALVKTSDDNKLTELLLRLAAVEEKHKDRLVDLYLGLDSAMGKEDLEARMDSSVMEGGFTTEEFIEKYRESMETASDCLSVAMMLEAQALDLYMRYSRKAGDEEGRTVLYDIAEDEKAHLRALGTLMDKMSVKGPGTIPE